MLAFLSVVGQDQIYCQVNYKINAKEYQYIQYCPLTNSCFEVSTDNFKSMSGLEADEASGSMCYSPNGNIPSVAGCSEFEAIVNDSDDKDKRKYYYMYTYYDDVDK